MIIYLLFSLHLFQDKSAVLPEEDDHPLIVAAKKELLGTNYSTTLEQVRFNLNVFFGQFLSILVLIILNYVELSTFRKKPIKTDSTCIPIWLRSYSIHNLKNVLFFRTSEHCLIKLTWTMMIC